LKLLFSSITLLWFCYKDVLTNFARLFNMLSGYKPIKKIYSLKFTRFYPQFLHGLNQVKNCDFAHLCFNSFTVLNAKSWMWVSYSFYTHSHAHKVQKQRNLSKKIHELENVSHKKNGKI
jgi:hypothetical protein